MVFAPPTWVPKLPFDPPDSIPISDFMLKEEHGRHCLRDARPPFSCGLSGAEYSALQVRDRVDHLARALSKELEWEPNRGTEWDKVIGVFSLNTVRSLLETLYNHNSLTCALKQDRYLNLVMGCTQSVWHLFASKRRLQ